MEPEVEAAPATAKERAWAAARALELAPGGILELVAGLTDPRWGSRPHAPSTIHSPNIRTKRAQGNIQPQWCWRWWVIRRATPATLAWRDPAAWVWTKSQMSLSESSSVMRARKSSVRWQ